MNRRLWALCAATLFASVAMVVGCGKFEVGVDEKTLAGFKEGTNVDLLNHSKVQKEKEALQRELAEVKGKAARSELHLQVVRFKGKMVVRSSVDSDHLVFNESLRATDPKLPDVPNFATSPGYLDEPWLKGSSSVPHPWVMERGRKGHDSYAAWFHAALRSILATGAYETPTSEQFTFNLDNRGLKSGRHDLRFQIAPEPGDWELTIELTEINPTTKERKLIARDQYNPVMTKDPANIPPIAFYVN